MVGSKLLNTAAYPKDERIKLLKDVLFFHARSHVQILQALKVASILLSLPEFQADCTNYRHHWLAFCWQTQHLITQLQLNVYLQEFKNFYTKMARDVDF